MTVTGLSVSPLASNIENLTNAKEDITSIAELTNSEDRLSTEVIENEEGAVIRVNAHADVQNVKTTYSVDSTKSQVVSFGDLKTGEVREIQVNFDENGNKFKALPKTTAVSDRVDFEKEVQGHKIKGSVSFTYDNGVVDTGVNVGEGVEPSQPSVPNTPGVVTPEIPEKPSVEGLLPVDEETLKALDYFIDNAHKGHKFEYKVVFEDKSTDLEVEYVDDATLEEGKLILKQEGSPMVVRVTYHEIYVDGVVVPKYKMFVNRVELQPGVAKQYIRGTKKVETPGTETPGTETPGTETPGTETPGTETPGTETPGTETPGTETPVEDGIEAGMPKNVKWTRTQLKDKGCALGEITGNYEIDGDLGVFSTEDALADAFDKAADQWDKDWLNKKITNEVYHSLPKGYTYSMVRLEDSRTGYKANLYDGNRISNDGQEVD